MSKLFIIERKEDWTSYYPSEDVSPPRNTWELPIDDDTGKRVQVINLCRHYKYLRHGYYCSLLAEARGHKVIPSVRTISELARSRCTAWSWKIWIAPWTRPWPRTPTAAPMVSP